MMGLVALPLSSSDALLAFPLAREMLPGLDMAAWQTLVTGLSAAENEGRGGILSVRNEAGYICGLCLYRVDRDNPPRLVVEHLVVFGMLNEAPIADALMQGIEAAAAQNGCFAIHSRVDAGDERLLERMTSAGHAPKLVFTCKPIACPARGRCGPAACIEPAVV